MLVLLSWVIFLAAFSESRPITKPMVCVTDPSKVLLEDLYGDLPQTLKGKPVELVFRADAQVYVVEARSDFGLPSVAVKVCDYYDGWAFWNWLKWQKRLICDQKPNIRWPVQVRSVRLDWLNHQVWVQATQGEWHLVTHLLSNCRWPNPAALGPDVRPYQPLKLRVQGNHWEAELAVTSRSFGFVGDVVWVQQTAGRSVSAVLMENGVAQLWEP